MTMPTNLLRRSLSSASMAGDLRTLKRATEETVRENAKRHLAERMAKLHGLPQKIGQIMSMSADTEKSQAFSGLRENAEPIPFEIVEPILETAWGSPIESVVAEMDPVGLAASLGQVHRATLHDGKEVAVKVAYPGIRKAVMNDLKMLGWLSAGVGDLRRGFDLASYREELVRDMREELDYRIELRNQVRHAGLARGLEGLVVPDVIERLSTENVLVSTWEDGATIDEAVSWPPRRRFELARRLLEQFLTSVFEHGCVHGDPHPGNYRFRDDPAQGPSVVLYDYGSVTTLTERTRQLLMRLIADTRAQRGDPMSLFVELGFNASLLEPIRAKLPAVCRVIFEPFCQDLKFDLSTWQRSQCLDDVLGDDRWNFRMAGPAGLILLLRAFRGVQYYLERLNQPVSWGLTMQPILDRNAEAIESLKIPASTGHLGTFESLAKHLRLTVTEKGSTKVSITLPASAIDELDSLMDSDTLARIRERNIDLPKIVRGVRRSGYAPSEVFTLEDAANARTIRVWME